MKSLKTSRLYRCGVTQPAQAVVVAVGALIQDGQVLLAHRSPSRRWYPNVWDLPGGHVERGESPLQALVRELHEELGVQVSERCCKAVTALILTAGDGVGELRLSIWSVQHWLGTPVNRCHEEHDQIGWVGVDDLADLTLAHDHYRYLLPSLIL